MNPHNADACLRHDHASTSAISIGSPVPRRRICCTAQCLSLLIGRDSEKTIPSGLAGLINGDVFQWGALMASSLITSLPPVLIYIIAQRWVVSGLASGAVKH